MHTQLDQTAQSFLEGRDDRMRLLVSLEGPSQVVVALDEVPDGHADVGRVHARPGLAVEEPFDPCPQPLLAPHLLDGPPDLVDVRRLRLDLLAVEVVDHRRIRQRPGVVGRVSIDLVQDINVRVVEPVVTVPHEQRKMRLLTQIDVSGVDELRCEEVAVDALLRHEQDPPREMNVGAVGVDRAEDPAVPPDLAVDPLERSLKRLQLVRPDVGRDRHSVLVDMWPQVQPQGPSTESPARAAIACVSIRCNT